MVKPKKLAYGYNCRLQIDAESTARVVLDNLPPDVPAPPFALTRLTNKYVRQEKERFAQSLSLHLEPRAFRKLAHRAKALNRWPALLLSELLLKADF